MTFTWFYGNPNGAYGEPATSDPTADPVTHAIALIAASLALTGTTAATIVESAKVTADAANRFTLGADGKLSWGNGSGAVDTILSRTAANELTLAAGDTFKADTITVSGTDTAAIYNALTGYRVNGAAASGKYLRGNGTNFVSGDIADADVPATIARDAEVVLQTLADAKGDLIGASAADTWAKLAVGANGLSLKADSTQATGLAWTIPKIPTVSAVRTAGDLSLSATLQTWNDVDTGLDLVVPAVAGDKVILELVGFADSAAVNVYFDFQTVAGSNWVGGTGAATAKGLSWAIASAFSTINGRTPYTVVSGDISGGNVTFRLRFNPSASAVAKGIYGTNTSSAPPLRVAAYNFGQ